jgi:hypothetical protein
MRTAASALARAVRPDCAPLRPVLPRLDLFGLEYRAIVNTTL